MSVLIKGMKMPKSCKLCSLLQDYDEDMYCPLNSYLNFGDIENVPDYVMDGCPLVEVSTPHGRLIDADILTERFENLAAQALDYVGKLNEQEDERNSIEWRRWSTIWAERSAYTHDLYDAPTVIESED